MAEIRALDEKTIDRIAAGEVIERPESIVKELVENAIDAGATAVTVEIKGGGIDFIRVTDNGRGIEKEDTEIAFLPHTTSKIRSEEDLFSIKTLGFRGEALSSIAAVSQVELMTKTKAELTGIRYCIENGMPAGAEEIGVPDGTTFIIRNVFGHIPARRKFLKTAASEAGYITEFMEHAVLAAPDISFRYIINSQTKIATSGNGNIKENIYRIYGRDIEKALMPLSASDIGMSLSGYIARPVVARNNRSYELFFVNGRCIEDKIISKALEEAYRPYLMKHKYPFAVIMLQIDAGLIDVNVHPRKSEVRFEEGSMLYDFIYNSAYTVLKDAELINDANINEIGNDVYKPPEKLPEPFEKRRIIGTVDIDSVMERPEQSYKHSIIKENEVQTSYTVTNTSDTGKHAVTSVPVQMELGDIKIIRPDTITDFRIAGQVFDTYWIIEYKDRMLMIDQHAAHEKVMYERFMKEFNENKFTSQYVDPPVIITLNGREENVLERYMSAFSEMGFEISPFQGNDYAIRAVPSGILDISEKEVFISMLDELDDGTKINEINVIHDRIATKACKAAVKGNMHITYTEAEELFRELLSLDNPYNCPHGRPTIIEMTKTEIEKKFKRII